MNALWQWSVKSSDWMVATEAKCWTVHFSVLMHMAQHCWLEQWWLDNLWMLLDGEDTMMGGWMRGFWFQQIHWSQISAWHSISEATIQKTHWWLLAVGPWWKPMQVEALKGEGRAFVFIMDLQFKNRMSLWCDDYGEEKFCKFFLDLDMTSKWSWISFGFCYWVWLDCLWWSTCLQQLFL